MNIKPNHLLLQNVYTGICTSVKDVTDNNSTHIRQTSTIKNQCMGFTIVVN